MILDSGERRQFSSGAVRDIQEGKGRCDLLPLKELSRIIGFYTDYEGEDQIIMDIRFFMQTKDEKFLYYAIRDFICSNREPFTNRNLVESIPYRHELNANKITTAMSLLEISKHYEEGANKYSARNWEKGISLHCYIDSGLRHYLKWVANFKDEPHDRAFLWNMLGCIWTLRNRPECDDLWEEM